MAFLEPNAFGRWFFWSLMSMSLLAFGRWLFWSLMRAFFENNFKKNIYMKKLILKWLGFDKRILIFRLPQATETLQTLTAEQVKELFHGMSYDGIINFYKDFIVYLVVNHSEGSDTLLLNKALNGRNEMRLRFYDVTTGKTYCLDISVNAKEIGGGTYYVK